MTKEITKSIILQEMQDKLALREFDPAKFLFEETVIPVYNIEQHLQHFRTYYWERSITTTGGRLMVAVPENERWVFSRYDVVFMGAGAYTVSGLYIVRKDTYPSDAFAYLDLTAGQTLSYHVELPCPVILTPGDSLYINIDGYTSIQDIRLYLDHMMEEVR